MFKTNQFELSGYIFITHIIRSFSFAKIVLVFVLMFTIVENQTSQRFKVVNVIVTFKASDTKTGCSPDAKPKPVNIFTGSCQL